MRNGLIHPLGSMLTFGLVWVVVAFGCASNRVSWEQMRSSEVIWCADDDGRLDTVVREGHDSELVSLAPGILEHSDAPVKENDIIDSCLGLLPFMRTATLCAGYVARSVAQDRAEGEAAETVGHAVVSEERPVFPVVFRGDINCDGHIALSIEGGDLKMEGVLISDYETTAWNHTEEFNRIRMVEQQVSNTVSNRCLDAREASVLANKIRDSLNGDWPIIGDGPGHFREDCLDVRLLRGGFIEFGQRMPEVPAASGAS